MKKILATLGLALMLTTGNAAAETAGTVNDMEITVAEADKALKALTKGEMTWAKLPKDDRKQLIQMMAPSKLVAAASKKGLTDKEKEAALAGFWMQKKMSKVEISDKEAEEAYNKMKKAAKAAKSKQKIPEFKAAKNNIKMQLAQEKVVSELMKNAKIKLK
ncbi:MAG: hypothetical protein E3J96_05695 [Sulfurovum sp.]|nr:MAG: hypothetical protein E3J96_05695 [Sulfurovum sp.]